jgi:hypothetical protein
MHVLYKKIPKNIYAYWALLSHESIHLLIARYRYHKRALAEIP